MARLQISRRLSQLQRTFPPAEGAALDELAVFEALLLPAATLVNSQTLFPNNICAATTVTLGG